MCGRFAVTTDPALLAEKIKAIDEVTGQEQSPAPNYNVAPTQTVSVLVKRHAEPGDESTRRLRRMRWGLILPWVKATAEGGPDTKGPLLINARSEKVTSSPAFRASVKSKRCLVPMDGWYEWAQIGQAKGVKTPVYMYAGDEEPLFMAGLWSSWRPRNEAGAGSAEPPVSPAPPVSPVLSCTILTADAVGPLADIHDRMPLTINEADWDRWLDPDAPVDEGLLRGHGDLDRIQFREVSRLVNNVRNNGPELIEATGPQQPTLL